MPLLAAELVSHAAQAPQTPVHGITLRFGMPGSTLGERVPILDMQGFGLRGAHGTVVGLGAELSTGRPSATAATTSAACRALSKPEADIALFLCCSH
mmetsp:Transcript_1683/g.3086  ORF Transcript_1683/g.3086 Transcript_1683/m.3086 type:complete len:97 (+) Transcript_1683:162-452(+)